MYIERKQWAKYTPAEIEAMRSAVANAPEDMLFTPEYAAAYLGRSSYALQYMRCHQSDGIIYSKVGRHVRYRKRHLDSYINGCEKTCTA